MCPPKGSPSCTGPAPNVNVPLCRTSPPPGDQLRDRPHRDRAHDLQRHLPARHRHHLAVLRASWVLHHLQGRSQHRLHLRPRKGPPGAGAGRVEVSAGQQRRHLHQERPEGRVHARSAIERFAAAAGRSAGAGCRQGGRHQDRHPDHDRGRPQRQDLPRDHVQESGRLRQVRAQLRCVHVGLVRRHPHAGLRLRDPGLRQLLVRLDVVRSQVHGVDQRGTHDQGLQEAGGAAARGRTDRAGPVAVRDRRLRTVHVGNSHRHLDELATVTERRRPAVRLQLGAAAAARAGQEGQFHLRRHDLGDRVYGWGDGTRGRHRVLPASARGAPAL